MREPTLDHAARLTDAPERNPLRDTLEKPPQPHPLTLLKKAGKVIAAAIVGVFTFIDEVNESMNQARAASSRFSGSQW